MKLSNAVETVAVPIWPLLTKAKPFSLLYVITAEPVGRFSDSGKLLVMNSAPTPSDL